MLQSIIITNSHGTYNMEIIVFTSNSRHNNSQYPCHDICNVCM